MLRPRKGVQVDYPQTITPEVRPIYGYWDMDPAQEAPIGGSPDMRNCIVLQGVLRKRPGYAQYPSAVASIGGSVSGIYSTQDTENNTHLIALYGTGGAKYNSSTHAWDALTGTLTGAASQLFTFETSQNAFVFSQGVDPVQRLPFNTLVFAALSADCPPARYLCRFADRLNLAFTVEGGVSKPFRHRRSVSSDHTNWTGIGSGFRDAAEFPYHLRGLRKIGTQAALYYERAIELVTRTEQAAAPFRYDIRTAEVGLYASYTLKGRNDLHFFLGNDDVYEFNSVQVNGVGKQVRDLIFGTLNASTLHRMFAEVLFDTQEYVLFLCTGASGTPDTAWVYNWQHEIWYPWTINGPTCACIHRLDDTSTIDNLTGTIDAQSWEFDSRIIQQAYPAMLTGHADGKIYLWSTAYTSDNGASIPCRWTSKDFLSGDLDPARQNRKITLRRIAFTYKDTGADFALNFSLSRDGGANWDGPYTVSIAGGTAGYKTATFDKQYTGDRIRWKMEQDSASQTFQIAAFYPEFEIRESPMYAS